MGPKKLTALDKFNPLIFALIESKYCRSVHLPAINNFASPDLIFSTLEIDSINKSIPLKGSILPTKSITRLFFI